MPLNDKSKAMIKDGLGEFYEFGAKLLMLVCRGAVKAVEMVAMARSQMSVAIMGCCKSMEEFAAKMKI